MSAQALKLLASARTALVLDHPFFGSLAWRLEPVEVGPEVTKTMATDGRSLFYSADYVCKVSAAELVFTVAHEVMHPAMQHHTRRGHRDPKRWNYAADYAINPLLKEAGFAVPADALLASEYAGMSAEQIYAALPSEPEGGEGDGEGDEPGAGSDLSDVPGAVMDAPEPAQDSGEWQVAVAQAVKVARMMGRLPASLAAAIKEQTKPVVDWRPILRRFVQQCASADFSYRMPNRRYIASGMYLPELRSESLPPIVIGNDTSGSITPEQQAAFRAEVQSIVDECQPEATHVVYCSAVVHHVDVFARGEPLTMERHGTGGTDFRPVFDYVDAQSIEPACLIYLTDGYGTYPEHAPAYPVLWAMTSDKAPPWGECVEIGAEEAP